MMGFTGDLDRCYRIDLFDHAGTIYKTLALIDDLTVAHVAQKAFCEKYSGWRWKGLRVVLRHGTRVIDERDCETQKKPA